MSRLVFPLIAIVLSLLPAVAPAEPVHKRPAPRWHGYGFLPGYQQPPNNTLPAYKQRAAVARAAQRNRRPRDIDPGPSFYGYDGDFPYFGRPGFYGGRYNGGSFGPCWTRTADRAGLELRLSNDRFKTTRGGMRRLPPVIAFLRAVGRGRVIRTRRRRENPFATRSGLAGAIRPPG